MKKQARARKSAPRSQTPAKRQEWSSKRSRTVKSNGGVSESLPVPAEPVEKVSAAEAIKRAVEALGDVAINDELAPKQLAELGTLYEDVAKRQAVYDSKSEEAKTAKKSLESAQEMLMGRVRDFTHPKPLPLFDQKQAESDRQHMLEGGEIH